MIIEGRSKDSRNEDPVFEEKLADYIARLLESQSTPLAIRTIGAVYGQEDSRDHILRAFEEKGIPVILVGGGFHDISLSKKIDRREHVVVSIEPGASEQTLNWVATRSRRQRTIRVPDSSCSSSIVSNTQTSPSFKGSRIRHAT